MHQKRLEPTQSAMICRSPAFKLVSDCIQVTDAQSLCMQMIFCGAWLLWGVVVVGRGCCEAWLLWGMVRVGQNRIYTPYMTVYLVIFLPKVPYIHRIYIILANPRHGCCEGIIVDEIAALMAQHS